MQDLINDKFEALVAAARQDMIDGDASRALARLSTAIFMKPHDTHLLIWRADVYLELCDINSAVANLSKALTLTTARGDKDHALTEKLARVHDIRGLALLDDGQYEHAIAAFNDSLALLGKNQESSNVRLHRALAFIGQENTAAASADIERIIELEHASADAFVLLARLQLRSHRLAAARENLGHALEQDPAHAAALELQGAMLASAKVYEREATNLMLLNNARDAISNLSCAIDMDPENPGLRRRRALAYKQHGNPTAASTDLETAIEIAGDKWPEAESLLIATYNDAGVQAFERGEYHDALRCFDAAVVADVTVPRYLVNRADAAKLCGKVHQALADYERALQMCDPAGARPDAHLHWEVKCKLSLIHHDAGVAMFNRTDYDGAFEAFTAAVHCNPNVVQYRLSRAEVAAIKGNWAVVRADAEAALRLSPDDPRARAMLARVVPV